MWTIENEDPQRTMQAWLLHQSEEAGDSCLLPLRGDPRAYQVITTAGGEISAQASEDDNQLVRATLPAGW